MLRASEDRSVAKHDRYTTGVGPDPTPRLGAHIPVLDGVRGLAILLVLIHHFGYGGGPDYPRRMGAIFFSVTNVGWVGVDLFFVLSGFLITGILYDAKGSNHYFRNFYMRRVLRIFPLYYGVLIACFVILPLLTQHALGQPPQQIWFWLYWQNMRSAVTGLWCEAPNPWGLGFVHFWSLAIEEQFYVLWPLVVFAASRRTLLRVCLGLTAVALATRVTMLAMGVAPYPLPFLLTPCRLDGLAAGALVALLVRGPVDIDRLVRPAVAVTLASGLALAGMWGKTYLERSNLVVASVGYTLLAIFFASVLLLLVVRGDRHWLGRPFRHAAMRFLGRYSYGTYVLHGLFLGWFTGYLLPVPMLTAWIGSYVARVVVHCAAACIISIAAAWLIWHLYEKHFLNLKRFFEYRSRSTIVPSASSRPRHMMPRAVPARAPSL